MLAFNSVSPGVFTFGGNWRFWNIKVFLFFFLHRATLFVHKQGFQVHSITHINNWKVISSFRFSWAYTFFITYINIHSWYIIHECWKGVWAAEVRDWQGTKWPRLRILIQPHYLLLSISPTPFVNSNYSAAVQAVGLSFMESINRQHINTPDVFQKLK